MNTRCGLRRVVAFWWISSSACCHYWDTDIDAMGEMEEVILLPTLGTIMGVTARWNQRWHVIDMHDLGVF